MSIDAIAYAKAIDLGENEAPQARLLLYVLAENTFNDTFVCVLSQDQLAYEAGRAGARTVRRYLDALETARVLIRKERRDPESGARLSDAIRLVGFKRWYRDNHRTAKSRGATGRASGQFGRKSQAANLAGSSTGTKRPDWPPASGQQVAGAPGQQVAGTEETRTTRTSEDSPPAPQGAREGEVQLLLREVLDAKPERRRVVDALGPLVRLRAFTAPDKIFALGVIADRAAGLSDDDLGELVRRVCERRRVSFKPADVEDAIREVEEAQRLALLEETKRRASEQRRAEEAAKAQREAERAAALKAANETIADELRKRDDAGALVEEFVRTLASPVERSLFRSQGGPNWTAPIVREQAVIFLAAKGVTIPSALTDGA